VHAQATAVTQPEQWWLPVPNTLQAAELRAQLTAGGVASSTIPVTMGLSQKASTLLAPTLATTKPKLVVQVPEQAGGGTDSPMLEDSVCFAPTMLCIVYWIG
jgi:hypothetical protein